jgi:hypothetical protein
MSARGKVLEGLIVSSATFAAFSKPVMAKNASATPATTAKIGLPSAVNDVRTPKSASPRTTTVTPMPMTTTRPKTSTKVMSMLTTTDSVIPTKLTIVRTTMKDSVTSSAGTRSKISPKYRAKPVASEPEAAKTADNEQMVIRKVRTGFRNALFTYSAAPAACGNFVASSAYASPVMVASVTPAANAIQNAPPTAPATRPMRT